MQTGTKDKESGLVAIKQILLALKMAMQNTGLQFLQVSSQAATFYPPAI